MTAPVRRRLVDLAVVETLASLLPFPVGLHEVPNDPSRPGVKLDTNLPDVRYAIVVPVPGGVGNTSGPPAAPEADADLEYDVRTVAGLGRGQQGCQWASDEVFRVLFTREAHGAPVNLITIVGHEEMDRSAPGGPGTATLLADVWQATMSLRLTVTRSG